MNKVQSRKKPLLITDAPRSYDQDLATRKRCYTIVMATRLPLMILATIFSTVPSVAVALLAVSLPLPLLAVLIANDRLPTKREHVNR
ncbi:MAG TPA: DUF3099 domain-containing protein, partial [Trebonia sp.]